MAEPKRQPVVRVEHLAKYFGAGSARVDALIDINMDVYPGQVVGLMGPSGRARRRSSTASPALWSRAAGESRSTAKSSMTIAGSRRFAPAAARQDRLHLPIPQSAAVSRRHRQCRSGARSRGTGAAASARARVELLDYLEVGHRKHAMPTQLSGGEAQRVAIARAFANRPRIILADEPTAPLDSARARIVMDLLRRIAVDQNAAIIVVTHDEMILDRFDHIFQLRDGQLASEVTASELSRS